MYLGCTAILGISVLYWVVTSRRPAPDTPNLGRAQLAIQTDSAPVRTASIRTSSRPIYRYSVIRGGAYSAAELEAALRTDPVAAAHYASLDRRRLQVTQAPQPSTVHVSYRLGDRVYWTRRKLPLPAGELLLTDGVLSARARCGNRISLTPQEPTQAAEPSAIDLGRIEPAGTDMAGDPAAAPTDVYSLPMLVHEIFPPPLAYSVPGTAAMITPSPPAYSEHASNGRFVAYGNGFLPLTGGRGGAPPEIPVMPSIPGVPPIAGATLPPLPVGPVVVWIPTLPLTGGYPAGFPPGPTASGTGPMPTVITLSRPGTPPITPLSNSGLPPIEYTTSGPILHPATGTPPPSEVLLPPTPLQPSGPPPPGAPPPVAQVPEPAPAALLLLGAAILARHRFSRLRSN